MLTRRNSKLLFTLLSLLFASLYSLSGDNANLLGFSALTGVASVVSTTTYPVVHVVDGDTLDIEKDGAKVRLRLIGINSPESVDPRRPVECFGKEASKHASLLLSNAKVAIESDPTQGTLDKYGRTLAYVMLEDGSNFNEAMIHDGYAYEYTYDKPYKYQALFKAAERDAKSNARGLWATSTCNGKK